MTFKGTPGVQLTDFEKNKKVCVFDERGYAEVKDEVYAAKMKRAGYEEVTLRYCECGTPFDSQGAYMTHCKTCAVHLAAKEVDGVITNGALAGDSITPERLAKPGRKKKE